MPDPPRPPTYNPATSSFSIDTPSVNGHPSGTTIEVYIDHDLDFRHPSHFVSSKFIVDKHSKDPTHLIRSILKDSIHGLELNAIEQILKHPHHAVICFATGKPGTYFIIICGRVWYVRGSPVNGMKEFTVLSINGDTVDLLTVDPNLNIFNVRSNAYLPTEWYWACTAYGGNPNFQPQHKGFWKESAEVGASHLLPSELTDMILKYNCPSIKNLTYICLNYCHDRYLKRLEEEGWEMGETIEVYEDYAGKGAEPLVVNLTYAQEIKRILPILHSLHYVSFYGDRVVFPNGFNIGDNEISKNWHAQLTSDMINGELSYLKNFGDPAGLLDLDIPGKKSSPPIPGPLLMPRKLDSADIPTGPLSRLSINSRKANVPPCPLVPFDLEAPLNDKAPTKPSPPTLRPRAGSVIHPMPNTQPTLSKKQRRHEEQAEVVHPPVNLMEESDDDLSLFGDSVDTSPPTKKSRVSQPSQPTGYKQVQVPQANNINTSGDWRGQYRPPTPHPGHESPIGRSSDEEGGGGQHPKINRFFMPQFPTRPMSPNRSNHRFQTYDPNSHFNYHSLHPNTQQHSVNTGGSFFNNNGPSNNFIGGNSEPDFGGAFKTLSSLMFQSNELAQRKLEQDEAHFQSKKNKQVSPSMISFFLNLMTTDGINPGSELTERAKAYFQSKDVWECKVMLQTDLTAAGHSVDVPICVAKAIRSGHLAVSRFTTGGLNPACLPVSTANTDYAGIDIEQSLLDHEANRELSSRVRKAITGIIIVVPRTIHFLVEHLRNFNGTLVLITSPDSHASKASGVWVVWTENHKQQLMESMSNGFRDLPAQIAYHVGQTFNNYFIAAQTGVPDPAILDSSLIMQQFLNLTHNVPLPADFLPNSRRNNNNNQRSITNSIKHQPALPTTNRANNSIRPAQVIHQNQPSSLVTSDQEYAQVIAPAISNGTIVMPMRNGVAECGRYVYRGRCIEGTGCPRGVNHVPVTDAARERQLVAIKRQAQAAGPAQLQRNGRRGGDFR